jgi:hypothetical protein
MVAAMGLRSNLSSPTLVIDLPRGRLEAAPRSGQEGAAERLVAMPSAWFGDLIECLPDGVESFADRLVTPLLDEVTASLDDAQTATPEELAWSLSRAFGARGLGLISFERWGEALVLVWRTPPGSGQNFQDFGARLVSRLLGDLLGVRTRGVTLDANAQVLRILLASPETCQDVRALVFQGRPTTEVLDLLTTGTPS